MSVSNYKNKQKRIVKLVNSVAIQYKKIVVNKTYLLVLKNNYIELRFKVSNFAHLCGNVKKKNVSAKLFYKKAIKGQITIDDIEFNSDKTYNYSIAKLTHMIKALQMLEKELFVTVPFKTFYRLYSYSATNKYLTFCLEKEDNKKDVYVPFSLRVEPLNSTKYKIKVEEVLCVLRKNTSQKKYDKIINTKLPDKEVNALLKSRRDITNLISDKLKE